MGKSLNDIKRDIAVLTLDIECLDSDSKLSAISHLEETIELLKVEADICQAIIEETEPNTSLQQISNNEIKQEPVVHSLNPSYFQGQIDNLNDMIKCDPCDVYLPGN